MGDFVLHDHKIQLSCSLNSSHGIYSNITHNSSSNIQQLSCQFFRCTFSKLEDINITIGEFTPIGSPWDRISPNRSRPDSITECLRFHLIHSKQLVKDSKAFLNSKRSNLFMLGITTVTVRLKL